MKIPMNKIVEVQWGDAFEFIGNNYRTKHKKNLTKTVGWIVDHDKHRIYISMFYCGIAKKYASPYVGIPKKMIENIFILK